MGKLEKKIERMKKLREQKKEESMQEQKQEILRDLAKKVLDEKGEKIKNSINPIETLKGEMESTLSTRADRRSRFEILHKGKSNLEKAMPGIKENLRESSRKMEKNEEKARKEEKRGEEWREEGFKPSKKTAEKFKEFPEISDKLEYKVGRIRSLKKKEDKAKRKKAQKLANKVVRDLAKEALERRGGEIKKADKPLQKLESEIEKIADRKAEGYSVFHHVIEPQFMSGQGSKSKFRKNNPDLVKKLKGSSEKLEKPEERAREREKKGRKWKREGFKPSKEATEEFKKSMEREKIEDKYLPDVKSPRASKHLLKSQTKKVTKDLKDLKELTQIGTRDRESVKEIKKEHKQQLQDIKGIGPKAADSIVKKAWGLAASERKKKDELNLS